MVKDIHGKKIGRRTRESKVETNIRLRWDYYETGTRVEKGKLQSQDYTPPKGFLKGKRIFILLLSP